MKNQKISVAKQRNLYTHLAIQNCVRCSLNLDQNTLGIIGAPCILFSKCAFNALEVSHPMVWLNHCCYRYGLKEGFKTKNVEVKHAHDVAAKFQQVTSISIHENVPEYEEARYVHQTNSDTQIKLDVYPMSLQQALISIATPLILN
jgi:hypothetical protein